MNHAIVSMNRREEHIASGIIALNDEHEARNICVDKQPPT